MWAPRWVPRGCQILGPCCNELGTLSRWALSSLQLRALLVTLFLRLHTLEQRSARSRQEHAACMLSCTQSGMFPHYCICWQTANKNAQSDEVCTVGRRFGTPTRICPHLSASRSCVPQPRLLLPYRPRHPCRHALAPAPCISFPNAPTARAAPSACGRSPWLYSACLEV